MKMRFVALAALALLPVLGNAAPCESEDFENRVSGASTYHLIKRFGVTETGAAQAILIMLPIARCTWWLVRCESYGSSQQHSRADSRALGDESVVDPLPAADRK